MEEFLEFLIRPLLSDPKKLNITGTTSQITVQVGSEDVGRVIGKQGAVINAIRTLFKTYCTTHSIPPVNLTLITPELK
jgi:hypothetical protein